MKNKPRTAEQKAQERDNARKRRRSSKPLPERQVSAHSHAVGKIIARATGTIWAPVCIVAPSNGGGVIYDCVRKPQRIADPTGAYGR